MCKCIFLGNEIFDVHKQPLQSDFNHLFIRQGTGEHIFTLIRVINYPRKGLTDSFHQKKSAKSKIVNFLKLILYTYILCLSVVFCIRFVGPHMTLGKGYGW